MYKYHYEGAVCTAQNLNEARKRIGWAFLPHQISPNNHFIVRVWQWDATDQDYSVEVLHGPGHQVFNEYVDALECFKNLVEEFPEEFAEDIKLELVHYHLGIFHALQSKILFPPIMATGV